MERVDVNYKNQKRYKTAKYPIRQPKFFVWLIWILAKFALIGKKYKIEKINTEDLKPPYFMLSNHMYFIDFELAAMATLPHRVNNVVNIDGYIGRAWLMELIGAICTRKFTNDMHLIKSIMKCLKRGDIVGLYPEARYSACGITSYIPQSVAKLVKMAKVPVVVVLRHGNHLHTPFWNHKKKRKVPLHTTFTQVLTKEQVEKLSVDEINKVLQEAFVYDEYKYQKENNILITEKYRAEGMHKVLYQCPHCLSEHDMDSKGADLFCKKCNSKWHLNEDGTLTCLTGETKFSHVPDWYNWERENVKQEVLNGTYHYEDDVDVYSLPRTTKSINLGKAKVKHTIQDGFVLEGHYNKQDYRIIRKPLASNSLHIEFAFAHIRHEECFAINTEDDCFYCYPKNKNVVTKLSFAVEEIYQYHLSNKD